MFIYLFVCDVVLFQEMPRYNEKRRMTTMSSTYGSLQRCRSNPSLHMLFMNESQSGSPAPSTRSANPHYSNGGWNGDESDSPRSMSICSTGSVAGKYYSLRGTISLLLIDNKYRSQIYSQMSLENAKSNYNHV